MRGLQSLGLVCGVVVEVLELKPPQAVQRLRAPDVERAMDHVQAGAPQVKGMLLQEAHEGANAAAGWGAAITRDAPVLGPDLIAARRVIQFSTTDMAGMSRIGLT